MTQDVGSDPTVGLPLCLLCGSVLTCGGPRGNAEMAGYKEGETALVEERI